MLSQSLKLNHFIIITLITSIWINVSEVFRYFVLVVPRVRTFFNHKAGVVHMDWGVFTIWGCWDTLLTAVLVLILFFSVQLKDWLKWPVLFAGTFAWLAVFVIFWVATANMGLSEWSILLIVLPLSWFEMIVGAWITMKLLKKYNYVV